MAYQQPAGLGDITDDIKSGLDALSRLASNVQSGGSSLAQKIQDASDYAVRLSNAATGAAAGAKAGLNAPVTTGGKLGALTTAGLVVGGLWLLSRGRRRA